MTSSTLPPPVRSALGAFIDYAGLFPPAKLALLAALEEYARERQSTHAWMLGRFIVPASEVDALDRAAAGAANDLSVILDAKADPRDWFGSAQALLERLAGRTDLGALEVPLPPLASRRETYDATIGQMAMLAERYGLRDRAIYIEIPRDERWTDVLPGTMVALARYRLGAKIRCGGVVASAFPSVDEVARFIAAAAAERVPFKATAGLHHPVRHRDEPTGFTMHGFLNLLCASVFAGRVDVEVLRAIIADESPASFALGAGGLTWRDLRATDEEIASARQHGFVAYGSCSFSEPVDDLIQLLMLPR